MTTSIDKIREQVRGVREEHKRAGSPGDGVRPYCQNPRCPLVTDDFVSVWPCPTLRLAEKTLKLALMLEQIRFDPTWQRDAERILAECAEEKGESDLPAGYTRVDPADGFGG